MEVMVPKLGVDFGRVINDGSSDPSGRDTAFLTGSEEAMLATPEMAGAFASLERLTALFGGRVWIVSKAGPRVQGNTERWLDHHGFFTITGFPTDHVRFVRRRADKAAVCEELGITHFVDDEAEVLQALEGVVRHLYLFGPQSEASAVDALPVLTWTDAEREVTKSIAD